MIKRFFPLALGLFVFWSCETEVDLNAPYEEYTTVYGIIDLSADTQVVRINKSFLGEGRALDFAAIKDSSEFNPGEVEAYLEYGNGPQVVQLEPFTIPNREPGIFYDEDILVFITDADLKVDANGNPVSNLNSPSLVDEFKLVVNVNGKTVTSATVPTYLTQSNISDPNPNLSTVNWASPIDNFLPKQFSLTPVSPGVRYEGRIIFHYRDHYTNGDVVDRSYTFNLGSTELPLGTTNEPFSFSYSPEGIFNFIANNVDCNNVSYRTLLPTEFIMLVAGEDLSRYMSINNPVTGIVTERPEFSNVEGENAIGLFSSRYKLSSFRDFNGTTRETLFTGEITGQLCFCDDSPGSSFPCPDINTPCDCN